MSAEKCSQVQLLADAAAAGQARQTLKVAPKDAKRSHDTVGSEQVGWFSGTPTFDLMITEGGLGYRD